MMKSDSHAIPGALEIGEVARRTGLSVRALRFYEARGLVRPLRSASGRRWFGPGELVRLHQIIVLKQAGFALSKIAALLQGRLADPATLLRAQRDHLAAEAARISEARASIDRCLSRIECGAPLDAATLCALIHQGDIMMTDKVRMRDQWQKVIDRTYTPEEQADWANAAEKLPPGFDFDAYGAKWRALGAKVKAALPLDPAGAQAQTLLDEWQALLAPFKAVATPAMWAGAERLHANRKDWEGEADPGFDAEVWAFVGQAMRARGEDRAKA